MGDIRLILLGVLALPQLAAAEDLLRAGGDHDFPPYEFIDESGEPAGFNVDLIRAIGRIEGFEVEFQLAPWEQSRAAIRRGAIDILPMYLADFREQDVEFATPHVIIYHEIFIRQQQQPLDSLDALNGRELLVQRDAWVHEQLLDLGLEVRLVLVDSEREALGRLAAGEFDAALVSGMVGRKIMLNDELDNLTTSGAPLFPVGYALAVPQGNQALLTRIESGLAELKNSGQFNRLYERWLGPVPARSLLGPWGFWLLILAPTVIALGLLGLVRAQSRRLKSSSPGIEARFRHDSLTGLPNRIELERAAADCLAQVHDGGGRRALLHVDLDQFKLVNDSSDYQGGDRIIVAVAELLQAHVGPEDFLARLGSDEFGLLLCPDQNPMATAEALRRDLERREFEADEQKVQITASIGVARLDSRSLSIGELLKQAETACQVAKESGRNRVHEFMAEDEAVAERHGEMRWVREVNLALKENRLALYFQTIEPARPDSGRPLIVELLLRMQMPDGRMASAGEFVPAAEKYFIAHRIDRWVLREALGWLERHRSELPELDRVMINLSARSLGDDRFLPFALEQIDQHKVPARLLGFELTETAVMTHLKTGLKTIERLRNLGCIFALDDFGVGISSMAYLKNLPIDMLKIDGSFARAALNSARERTMLSEINDLGHVLGKTTVIEYVENTEARALMAELGLDLVQGYAISRLQPIDQLLALNRTGA